MYYKEGHVWEIHQSLARPTGWLCRCFLPSSSRSTFSTTANRSSPCVLLAQQEQSSRPRIQLLRSPFVAFAWLITHYLDLHVSQERSHRSQSREHRGDERHDTPHRNARRQRHLQEHLVVFVADDQAPDVPFRDQLLGTVYQFATGNLDLLSKGMFVFRSGVVYPFGLFAHGSCPFTLVVRFFCPL